MRRQHAGFNLVEILLVLVISAGVFFLGMQLYLSMRKDADARQVQANVDAIFQAMSNYYRVNCYGQTKADLSVIPGTLNPAYVPSPPTLRPINITTELIQPGFLAANALVQTPIVNAIGAPGSTKGYVAQFNKKTSTRRVCTAGTGAANSPTCTQSVVVGTVIEWQAQVAVQLDTTPATTPGPYLGMLAGDCLSRLVGTTVTPCTAASTGTYVVGTNSFNASKKAATYWQTTQTVKRFANV